MQQKNNQIGFNLIIGNPPYLQISTIKENVDLLEKQKYKTYLKSSDIYCLFYEKSINLIKDEGITSFITSNKWLQTSYGLLLRNYITENTNPLILFDFRGTKIFKNVGVDSNILTFKKSNNIGITKSCLIDTQKYKNVGNLSNYFEKYSIPLNTKNSWCITSEINQGIKIKVDNIGVPLKDLGFKIYSGIDAGLMSSFIINEETKNKLISECPKSELFIKPLLRGRDIEKYKYNYQNTYIIWVESGFTNKNRNNIDAEIYFKDNYYPIYKHILDTAIKENKLDVLKNRVSQGDYFWELRKCSYQQKLETTKIVWADLYKENNFAWDNNNNVVINGCYFADNIPKYLYAILNSKLILTYFKTISIFQGKNMLRWLKVSVEKIPIANVSEEDKVLLSDLVDKIAEYKQLNKNTKETEKTIDNIIYKIYSLNDEEITYLIND